MPDIFIKPPIVIDTNLLISAMISPNSIIHEVLKKALEDHTICTSQKTLDEFLEVATRDKFLRFFRNIADRDKFIAFIIQVSKIIEPAYRVNDCRDPKDNMFLEVALTCNAIYLVSGDKDLLSLNPYHHIQIITPAQFLEI
ncbi:putative toxin-antitoxin system toxin component, PIN family [Moraxella oblonga]|uniref:putative toxin-antitoxin system toxin component, PIN family n=1 Tax=Moraxella oblonga TaxID=200413 RepID=UPI000835DB56|nr:putative toxin-antitoxin system toxin component, PIN family [Moraxella oblonga]